MPKCSRGIFGVDPFDFCMHEYTPYILTWLSLNLLQSIQLGPAIMWLCIMHSFMRSLEWIRVLRYERILSYYDEELWYMVLQNL